MRVSTSMIYQSGGDAISRQQAELLSMQQRLSSGRRLLTAADDPAGAAQALSIASAKARNAQYDANINVARDALMTDESTLSQVTDVLQGIRTLAVNGGSGSLSDADRSSLADSLAGQLQQLVGLANGKGGDGNYLFSGYALATQPFVQTPAGVVYQGDQGQRLLNVGPGRSMPISESGDAVFMQVPGGNGTFATAPAAGNAGSGVIDAGSVTDPAAINGHSYQIAFTSAATYDVVDMAAPVPPLSTGNAYVSGNAIALPGSGIQVTITGAPSGAPGPAYGDKFDVTPSAPQSVFKTVQSLIDTLRTPGSTAAGRARVANGIGEALTNLDQGLGNVLSARAGLGASLNELDSLATGNDNSTMQYDTTLSRLVDLDYARALSDFAQQQVAFEAAQKSFLKVSGLSLFSYL